MKDFGKTAVRIGNMVIDTKEELIFMQEACAIALENIRAEEEYLKDCNILTEMITKFVEKYGGIDVTLYDKTDNSCIDSFGFTAGGNIGVK